MKGDRTILRSLVNNAYDMQKLRIQTGARLVSDFYTNMLPAESTEDEEKQDRERAKVLKRLEIEYKRFTDGVVKEIPTEKKFNEKRQPEDLITDYVRFTLVAQYLNLLESEERVFKTIGRVLEDFPVYEHFLKDIRGCGPAMSAVMLAYFDFSKSKYVSSLWRYAGLDVVTEQRVNAETGEITEVVRARGRYKEHLVETKYVDREGKEQTKMGLSYNPFLHTKLLGVLASCLLRSGSEYKKYYDDYKARKSTDPRHAMKSKGHIANMAERYMIQRLLKDLYVHGRTLGGFEVYPEYHEAYHGHVHGSPADRKVQNG